MKPCGIRVGHSGVGETVCVRGLASGTVRMAGRAVKGILTLALGERKELRAEGVCGEVERKAGDGDKNKWRCCGPGETLPRAATGSRKFWCGVWARNGVEKGAGETTGTLSATIRELCMGD